VPPAPNDRLEVFAGRVFLTAFGAALVMLRRIVERRPGGD